MKCRQCRSDEVEITRGNHVYTESGLPNVTLGNVESRRCRACKDVVVVIPRPAQLHKLLAESIVKKPFRLSPEEIRFLRTHVGWSGTDFARQMGVTASQVSRWENAAAKMSHTADRLLRMFVVSIEPIASYPLELLAEIGEDDAPAKHTIDASAKGWLERAAA